MKPREFLDGVAAPNCPRCLVAMVDEGSVREVDRGEGVLLVEGAPYWACPSCGLVRAV